MHNYYHLRHKTICIAFAYFDHTIGLVGENLRKLHFIDSLRDGGNCEVLVVGDFNMIPADWTEDVLDRMGMTLIVPDVPYTCKTTTEKSLIDYLLISRNLAPFIKNLRTVGSPHDTEKVPWSPHCGLMFELHAIADSISVLELNRPKTDKDATGPHQEG